MRCNVKQQGIHSLFLGPTLSPSVTEPDDYGLASLLEPFMNSTKLWASKEFSRTGISTSSIVAEILPQTEDTWLNFCKNWNQYAFDCHLWSWIEFQLLQRSNRLEGHCETSKVSWASFTSSSIDSFQSDKICLSLKKTSF